MTFVDHNTFANLAKVQTTHLYLDLFVDFPRKVLTGSVQLTLAVIQETKVVVLDTRFVNVKTVKQADTELKVRN